MIKQGAREFLLRLFGEFSVPVHYISIVSVQPRGNKILNIAAVDLFNYRTGQRMEITVPVVFDLNQRQFLRPSVFYLNREPHILGPGTIEFLFEPVFEGYKRNIFRF